jgi:hypothetical protein
MLPYKAMESRSLFQRHKTEVRSVFVSNHLSSLWKAENVFVVVG